MRVEVRLVGLPLFTDRPEVPWPPDWPPPTEGQTVHLPYDDDPQCPFKVRHVLWWPLGDAESEDTPEPFVQIVLGPLT